MKITNVDSSWVKKIGYNGDAVYVKMHSGTVYKYSPVKPEEFHSIKNAPSVSAAVRDILIFGSRFKCTKLKTEII